VIESLVAAVLPVEISPSYDSEPDAGHGRNDRGPEDRGRDLRGGDRPKILPDQNARFPAGCSSVS
jgi:hypothetical protein